MYMADNTDVRERLLPDLPGEQEVRAPVGNVEPPQIDVIIGHRLGSGGSEEYEVCCLETVGQCHIPS